MFRDDSIPELRRLLAVAHERIRELEAREPEVVEVDRIVTVQVEGPERIVDRVKVVQVEGPERIVDRVKVVQVEGPERIVDRVKVVQVEGPERVVYIENPELERTIRDLQERLCQFTSV